MVNPIAAREIFHLWSALIERIQALRFFADEECPLRAAGTEPTVVPGERVHVRGERPDRGTVEPDGTWLYLKVDGVPATAMVKIGERDESVDLSPMFAQTPD